MSMANNSFLSSSSEQSDSSSVDLLFNSDHDDNEFSQPRQQQQAHWAAIDIVSDDNNEGSNIESLIPIEVSWQYLSNLPYRHIVLYDDVDWGSTASPVSDAYGLTDDGGKGVMPMMMTPGAGAEDSGGRDKGTLAFVPPQTISAMKFTSPHLFQNNSNSSPRDIWRSQPTIVFHRAGYLAKFLRKTSTLSYVWYLEKYPEKYVAA